MNIHKIIIILAKVTANVKVNPKPQPPSGDPNLKYQTPAKTSSDSGEILIP